MTKEDKQNFDQDSIKFFVKSFEKVRCGETISSHRISLLRSICKRVDFGFYYLVNCRSVLLKWNYNTNQCPKKSKYALRLIDTIEEKIEEKKRDKFLESLDSILTYNLIGSEKDKAEHNKMFCSDCLRKYKPNK